MQKNSAYLNSIHAATQPKRYNPRHPERTLLYQTIAGHYETWLDLASAGQFDGQGVQRTPKPYVRQAFAKYLECDVLPRLPVRQWVLSIPKRLRYFMQRDGAVLNIVLRIFLRVIAQSLQSRSPGAANANKTALHIGAVAFIHRFGSSLNEHVHFHVAWSMGCLRKERSALMLMRQSAVHPAPPHPARLCGPGPAEAKEMLAYRHNGFSVDASVRIEAHDRAGLERLLRHRYFGALAPNSPLRSAAVAMALPAGAQPATSQAEPATPGDGALGAGPLGNASGAQPTPQPAPQPEPPKRCPAHYLWAVLSARIYEVFPLLCSLCGGQMRIIAFITHSAEIRQILDHIGLQSEPPRIASARGPPLWDDCDAQTGEGIQEAAGETRCGVACVCARPKDILRPTSLLSSDFHRPSCTDQLPSPAIKLCDT